MSNEKTELLSVVKDILKDRDEIEKALPLDESKFGRWPGKKKSGKKNCFLSHTRPEDEMGGRFKAVETHTVIGRDNTDYPAAAPWTRETLPTESSLGYAIDEQEPIGTEQEIEDSIRLAHGRIVEASDAASPSVSLRGEVAPVSAPSSSRPSPKPFKRRI